MFAEKGIRLRTNEYQVRHGKRKEMGENISQVRRSRSEFELLLDNININLHKAYEGLPEGCSKLPGSWPDLSVIKGSCCSKSTNLVTIPRLTVYIMISWSRLLVLGEYSRLESTANRSSKGTHLRVLPMLVALRITTRAMVTRISQAAEADP